MEEEEVLRNKDPEVVTSLVNAVTENIQVYGWLLLVVIVLAVYMYNKMQPRLNQWTEQREASSYKKMDSGKAQSRLEAMEKARMKMQEQLDRQAEEFVEKQKQKEEEKRQARLEDWDRHQEGRGYRSKTKPTNSSAPVSPHSSTNTKPKKSLKPDYSPLMGGGSGGMCYRPARRGGAGGG